MAMVPVLAPRREWWCPNCTTMEVTETPIKGSRYHHCAGMGGIAAPMLERYEKAHVVAVVREDYVGNEVGINYAADGTPIMAVHKITDDVQHCVVFCPTAVASVSQE